VLSLKCLGHSKVYKRTLAYLESCGHDVMELDEWASELVEDEIDEKNAVYVRCNGRLILSI
jgi:tRNA(Ser,Leu) C12 N-acetylase TAN1